MINENQNPWKTLKTEIVYDNNWITVFHNDVITPGNTNGIYGKVHFKNYAIGIVPVDDEGYTYLVGQYRYAINAYSWEIPEGGGLVDSDILAAAKRELLEETGITAGNWMHLSTLHTSNSATDETAFLFLAQCLSFSEMQPDVTEQLQVKKIKLEEAIQMAMKDEITDAMSVSALLKLHILKEKNKIKL